MAATEKPQTQSVNNDLKCNTEDMLRHLQLIAKATGQPTITIQTYRSDDKRDGEVFQCEPNSEDIAKIAKLCESGYNISVVPQRMKGSGRKKENVRAIRFLVVDIDNQMTSDQVKLIIAKVKPAFIVESSRHRYHIYYRAECKPEVYTDHARVVAEALGGDRQATDCARAFRLAGTINWKTRRRHFVARLREAKKSPGTLSTSHIVELLGGSIRAIKRPDKIPAVADGVSASQISQQEIERLLNVIPAVEYKIWLDIGMAIHDWNSGDVGFSVWDAWSRIAAEKYNEDQQKLAWNGFRQGGGRTIGSLRWYATQFDSNTKKDGKSWFPISTSDIVEYAKDELTGRIKISGKNFYVFANGGWRNDQTAAARALHSIVKELLETARRSKSEIAIRALKSHASYGQSVKMLDEFRVYPELDASGDDFDAKPELLGVPNGVVDLRTGEFRGAQPEDMASRSTAAQFDATATCPIFQRFMGQIAKSSDYRRYLQTVLGYLLIGHCVEQKAFFMLGRGSNGKGTLTRAILAALGNEYCTTLSPAFMKAASKGNGNGPTPALMTLRGTRVAFCTETERKNGIDEPFFKQLTGNDALTGRHNYEGQDTFKPRCKLLVSTNAMPDWQYGDQALWRRVTVLPFTRQFKGDACNSNLDAQLAAEASGILNWMIAGAKRYLAHGLGTCAEVVEATEKAHQSSDTVQRWIEAECRTGPDLATRSSEAFDRYQAFVDKRRLVALTQKKFKTRMLTLGYSQKRTNQSVVYKGLALTA